MWRLVEYSVKVPAADVYMSETAIGMDMYVVLCTVLQQVLDRTRALQLVCEVLSFLLPKHLACAHGT